jgi:uncharacterized protein (TIGR02001 family)
VHAYAAASSSRETRFRASHPEPPLALIRALALGSMLYAAGAGAQFTGTLSAVSDYRFRGVSLSDQKPAAQASVDYDDPAGWYGGVFGSTVQLAGDPATTGQAVAYLGVAKLIDDGFHWDAGVAYSAFSASRDYDYGEVYAGITSSDFNARVHYSPDYFGFGGGSLYGEMNGTHRLGGGLTLLGHIGVLVPVGDGDDRYASTVRNPVDARAGLGFEMAGLNVQVAWVGITGTGNLYPVYGMQRRNTVVASVSWSF